MNNSLLNKSIVFFMSLFILFITADAQTDYKEINVPMDTSGFINVENGQLYFEIVGDGDVILFVHDGVLNLESWAFQVSHFSKDYKVIRYDRRGYGRSSKAESQYSDILDLENVVEQLGIEKAILIGCSAGGKLCIDYTLKHPDKVRMMILVGPVLSGFYYTNHIFNRGGKLTPEILNDNDKFLKFWYTEDPYSIYEKNTEARQFAYDLLMKYPHNISLDKINSVPPERPALGALSEISAPTLLVAGEYDIPDVHAHIGAIDAGLKNSRRVLINNAGHLSHIEHPDIFNKLVDDFIAEQQFFSLYNEVGLEKAIETYKKAGKLNTESFPVSENYLNEMGYQYLFSYDFDKALDFFKIMVLVYSESANAYDSYGEALKAVGRNDEAIINLKKSLELNPNNTHAIELLKQLEEN